MKLVKGNKTVEMPTDEYLEFVKLYEKVVYDIGTGDGRYVYKKAIENPKTLFVGIDPSEKQMQIYSKKANKEHLKNVLFVIGSIEVFPKELQKCADSIVINLPWGSLLKEIVTPSLTTLTTLENCYKKGLIGKLSIIFGFNPDLEPTETERLALERIDEKSLQSHTVPLYNKCGFNVNVTKLPLAVLNNLETTWGKRLQLTLGRDMFLLANSSIDL